MTYRIRKHKNTFYVDTLKNKVLIETWVESYKSISEAVKAINKANVNALITFYYQN